MDIDPIIYFAIASHEVETRARPIAEDLAEIAQAFDAMEKLEDSKFTSDGPVVVRANYRNVEYEISLKTSVGELVFFKEKIISEQQVTLLGISEDVVERLKKEFGTEIPDEMRGARLVHRSSSFAPGSLVSDVIRAVYQNAVALEQVPLIRPIGSVRKSNPDIEPR